MALLTQTEYARHRKEHVLDGGTHVAVRKALDTGRIHYETDSKLIDPDKADAEWARNTEPRPARASKPQITKLDPTATGETPDYNACRAKREYYDSELARLKVEKERGRLADVAVVKKVLFEAGKIIRAGHEDIISQLAPDLASETNIQATERILKKRLDKLDTSFADRIEEIENILTVAQDQE